MSNYSSISCVDTSQAPTPAELVCLIADPERPSLLPARKMCRSEEKLPPTTRESNEFDVKIYLNAQFGLITQMSLISPADGFHDRRHELLDLLRCTADKPRGIHDFRRL